jgi:serine phosphatase RsbU (regulator of sigma subunit)
LTALNYYFDALKIDEEINNRLGIAKTYANIGYTYYCMKKGVEAKKWILKSLDLSKQMSDKYLIQNNYDALSLTDVLLNDYKSALENYQASMLYRDSIFNEENVRQQTQSEMQYEFDKKVIATKAEQDKKDILAQAETRKQKIITLSISLGFFIVVIFAFFVFKSLQTTKKQKSIIEHQKFEVEQQKMLVESQKHLIEEKHKEITDSINYAERIQRSFLATKDLLDKNLKDYFVFFMPKDVVSGDFYWAASVKTSIDNGDKNLFYLVTADSTGHGVPGAIMSLLNITSLEKALESYEEPSDILNSTRVTIIDRLKKDGSADGGKDGMDCSLLMFDYKENILKIAAANNPVWIVRNSESDVTTREVIEIKPDKMPVGKHDRQNISFTQKEFKFQKGDVIFTLTDGFPDQFGGESGKKFMSKKLRELLAANSGLPMQMQLEQLKITFANWKKELEQVDDVTVIGVRI